MVSSNSIAALFCSARYSANGWMLGLSFNKPSSFAFRCSSEQPWRQALRRRLNIRFRARLHVEKLSQPQWLDHLTIGRETNQFRFL
jgi:hypothetical protein